MEKLERDGEDGRQILASHQKLHPDAISYIAPRILVTSRLFGFCCWVIWGFFGGYFSRRTVFYLFIFTFMHSERKSVQWKLVSLHYLFFPISVFPQCATLASMDKNQIWDQLTKNIINTILTKFKERLWRNRSKKLISLEQLCYITGILLVFRLLEILMRKALFSFSDYFFYLSLYNNFNEAHLMIKIIFCTYYILIIHLRVPKYKSHFTCFHLITLSNAA